MDVSDPMVRREEIALDGKRDELEYRGETIVLVRVERGQNVVDPTAAGWVVGRHVESPCTPAWGTAHVAQGVESDSPVLMSQCDLQSDGSGNRIRLSALYAERIPGNRHNVSRASKMKA